MPRMPGGLIDEVEQHPAQVPTVTGAAWGLQLRRADEAIRGGRPVPVGGDRLRNRRLGSRIELGPAVVCGFAAHLAVDPPPLHMGQMVHDPDQAQQCVVGAPPRRRVIEAGGLAHHRAA